MALIDLADYPSIRAAIDVSLDEESLPDDVIGLSIYKGLAERRISDQQPVVDVYSKAAAALLCASLLCTKVPQIIRETDAGVTTERAKVDYEKLAADLLVQSNQWLGLSLNITLDARRAARRPNLFDVAHGSRRGQ